MLDLLYSMNQEVFEKHFCSQGSHYEKYGRFLITQRKPSRETTKLTLFTVIKDEWSTKEDIPKVCIARAGLCQNAPLMLKRH